MIKPNEHLIKQTTIKAIIWLLLVKTNTMNKSLVYLTLISFTLGMISCESVKNEITEPEEGGPGVAIDTSQVELNHPITAIETPEAPEGYNSFFQNTGDLDGDGVPELAIGYNTKALDPDEVMDDVPRELIIYKQKEGAWSEWYRSSNALMSSAGGGMMGDPFDTLRIEDGKMTIVQLGGSSWKWNETETYQWQKDDFKMIHQSSSYGKFCEYWKDTEFDFIEGKFELTITTEPCDENGEVIEKEAEITTDELLHQDIVVMLKDKGKADVFVEFPNTKEKVYIATKE